jgi:hypothetical protein
LRPADCLPRKELFEAWEVARRTRRRFRGGRVLDLACGHDLLAHLMLLLDDSSPRALACDPRLPATAAPLAAALAEAWPRLRGRVELAVRPLAEVAVRAGRRRRLGARLRRPHRRGARQGRGGAGTGRGPALLP